MLLDNFLFFSRAQAVTATAVSTDYLDMSAYRDIGTGDIDIEIFCNVDIAATAAGAATVTISLESATDAAFSSPVVHMTTAAIPKATLVVGYQPIAGWKVPANVLRYMQLRYTIATGPLTAGSFTAALTLASQRATSFPNIVL